MSGSKRDATILSQKAQIGEQDALQFKTEER